jgi:hypothetical protein
MIYKKEIENRVQGTVACLDEVLAYWNDAFGDIVDLSILAYDKENYEYIQECLNRRNLNLERFKMSVDPYIGLVIKEICEFTAEISPYEKVVTSKTIYNWFYKEETDKLSMHRIRKIIKALCENHYLEKTCVSVVDEFSDKQFPLHGYKLTERGKRLMFYTEAVKRQNESIKEIHDE